MHWRLAELGAENQQIYGPILDGPPAGSGYLQHEPVAGTRGMPVASFIDRHPTTRMLALSFLLMIGFALIADGVGFHIPRGYLYAAMAFSTLVEVLNVLARRNRGKKQPGVGAPHG